MKNIFKKLPKLLKRSSVALLAVAVLAAPATVMAGYGPNGGNRVIYDFSNPAQREGAFDGPRFNSYINTNVYGDERAFLDAKECAVAGDSCYTQGASGNFKDDVTPVVGKEYMVRAYVHNIANPSTNGSNNDGIGVARNTRIRFEIPAGTANGFTLQSRITADNSIPGEVYDTADFRNNTQAFGVEFISGSARIFNDAHPNGLVLNDAIMSASGTQIGYDQMNGIFPGCFDFSAFVTIRVKITAPSLKIEKRVSKVAVPKLTDSSERVTAKLGDTISWRIDYRNTGTKDANAVTIRDTLPAGLTLVPGSITWIDANHPTGVVQADTVLGAGGVNLGNYAPNGSGLIRFQTTINKDFKECEIRNISFGRAENVGETSDDAFVTIENCQPTTPPAPKPPVTTTLPKTGPGNVLGIFAATTVAAALAHRYWTSRRYSA